MENDINELNNLINKEDIDKMYKKLSLKYHPDKNGGDSEMFLKLREAYESVLEQEQEQMPLYNFEEEVLYKKETDDLINLFNDLLHTVNDAAKEYVKDFENPKKEEKEETKIQEFEDIYVSLEDIFNERDIKLGKKITILSPNVEKNYKIDGKVYNIHIKKHKHFSINEKKHLQLNLSISIHQLIKRKFHILIKNLDGEILKLHFIINEEDIINDCINKKINEMGFYKENGKREKLYIKIKIITDYRKLLQKSIQNKEKIIENKDLLKELFS